MNERRSRTGGDGPRACDRASWSKLAGAVMISIALSACGRSVASPTGSGSAASSLAGSSSTTTTTTLPAPVAVPGSLVTGTFGFLGQAYRVQVAAVPDGAASAPLAAPGTAAYLTVGRIAFRRFGSGPDLLLVTGEDGSMASWPPPFLAQLAQHYRVTIFDLPGTGYSGPLEGPLSIDRLADETAGLVAALHLVRPAVLGWGLGGEVAIALAERHGGSLGSLVLVDTSSGGRGATPPSAANLRIVSSPSVTPTELAGVFFSSRFASAEQAWLQGAEATVPDDLTQPAIVAEGRLQRVLWSSGTLAASVGSIRIPTLVVSGSDDSLFPAPDASLLGSDIAGAKVTVFQGADYAAMLEITPRFVSALETFTG